MTEPIEFEKSKPRKKVDEVEFDFGGDVCLWVQVDATRLISFLDTAGAAGARCTLSHGKKSGALGLNIWDGVGRTWYPATIESMERLLTALENEFAGTGPRIKG
jgi:hypothetical protein